MDWRTLFYFTVLVSLSLMVSIGADQCQNPVISFNFDEIICDLSNVAALGIRHHVNDIISDLRRSDNPVTVESIYLHSRSSDYKPVRLVYTANITQQYFATLSVVDLNTLNQRIKASTTTPIIPTKLSKELVVFLAIAVSLAVLIVIVLVMILCKPATSVMSSVSLSSHHYAPNL